MPITTTGGALILTPALVGVGMIGTATPKLSSTVAQGLSLWADTRKVQTADVGTLGAGVGLLPLLVPAQLFVPLLIGNFVAQGIFGPLAPLYIAGLAPALSAALLPGFIKTNHPAVGLGVATASIKGPPAVALFLQAFEEEGMSGEGPQKLARALGLTFDQVFAPFLIPVPIVGPPSPAPSAGVGFGSIL